MWSASNTATDRAQSPSFLCAFRPPTGRPSVQCPVPPTPTPPRPRPAACRRRSSSWLLDRAGVPGEPGVRPLVGGPDAVGAIHQPFAVAGDVGAGLHQGARPGGEDRALGVLGGERGSPRPRRSADTNFSLRPPLRHDPRRPGARAGWRGVMGRGRGAAGPSTAHPTPTPRGRAGTRGSEAAGGPGPTGRTGGRGRSGAASTACRSGTPCPGRCCGRSTRRRTTTR